MKDNGKDQVMDDDIQWGMTETERQTIGNDREWG